MGDVAKDAAVKLVDANLNRLQRGISVPRYDRSGLTPGIVHIGVGNFHRAHQAWYLHRLMQMGLAQDWAIIGAGMKPYDTAMRDRLLNQDCLTTLIELDPAGMSAEVVGSMIGYVSIEEGNGPLVRQMADPLIRMVSLTVTEGGYYRDANGDFDCGHADIQHDARNPDTPRTAFGAMVAALKMRQAAGDGPFTVLCCDNLQGNGLILKQCVIELAKLSNPDLADWIDRACTFPNSMVDCIVPATTPDVIDTARSLGVDDAAPVTHENFRQWVIEDNFCAGRPAWEKAGATMTADVCTYEAMKLRILNGGHQLLANVGEVLGIPTIADCMQDAKIRAFFQKVQMQEILPYVQPVPDMTPEDYLGLVERRFSNPAIHDTTRRVAFDGSSRHPGFILPTIRDAMASDGEIRGLALAEALWARMCWGVREDGSNIEPNDPNWVRLQEAAQRARNKPGAWLAQRGIYGPVADDPLFAAAFCDWLDALWTDGCRATLRRFLTA